MPYDIYGNPLKRGYCEVHPNIGEEYPCSLCLAETELHQRKKEHQKAMEREHQKAMEREYQEAMELAQCNEAEKQKLQELKQIVSEIENAMERWHLCRDEDVETLEAINAILLGHGMLKFFNKSQELKYKLSTEENDFKALGLGKKLIRHERTEKFELLWLPKLKEKCNVEYDAKMDRYTFEVNEWGTVDFYPKANKILIRQLNKWHQPGLQWIIQKLNLS